MEMSIVLDGRIIAMNVTENGFTGTVYALTENMSFYVFRVTLNSIERLLDIKI